MTAPETESEPLAPKSRRPVLDALVWGVACALCASSVWLGATALFHPSIDRSFSQQAQQLPSSAYKLALHLIVVGAVAGALAGFPYHDSGFQSLALAALGAIVGSLGGVFLIPITDVGRGRLDPLTTAALFWSLIGFCTGVAAHRFSLLSCLSDCPRHESRLVRVAPICALLTLVLTLSLSSIAPAP